MNIQDTGKKTGLVNNLYGKVKYRSYDKNGNTVSEGTVSNNIVVGIRKPIMALLSGINSTNMDVLPFIRTLKLGTDSTPPSNLQENLIEEIPGSDNHTRTRPTLSEDGLSATFAFLYDASDSSLDNVTIREMGLFAADGTMVARTVVGNWQKVEGLFFEIYWTIGYQQDAE